MKKSIILCISVLTVCFLTSCEDVIQVKLDKATPIITIDAFVNDLRVDQKVRLTYTDSYFSQKLNDPIQGASVTIKDLTNGQVFNFSDHNNGDYVYAIGSLDTIGRLDHLYELTVVHQGNTFTAKSTLKRTTTIDSIDVEYKEAGAFGGEAGYEFSFLGFDPVGPIADFYWVKSFKNGVFFNKGGEINISWNGGGGDASDGLPFIPPIAQGITPFGAEFKKNDVCRVEIHSINLETYNFLTQVQSQTTNSGLFATTPENVKTNIASSAENVKIVGWFCMSAVSFREKIAQ